MLKKGTCITFELFTLCDHGTHQRCSTLYYYNHVFEHVINCDNMKHCGDFLSNFRGGAIMDAAFIHLHVLFSAGRYPPKFKFSFHIEKVRA